MNKHDFLLSLQDKLSGLPQDDATERLHFYSEMIDDRMEEGLSEEEAVSAAGPVSEIAAQAIAETTLAKIAKERITPKTRLKAGEIVLLALGSPIWLSLGIAASAVILSLYVSLWSVIISLWAVFVSLAACAGGGVLTCVIFAAGGNGTTGLATLAAGMVCAGLAIFSFYGCKAATKGVLLFTKKLAIWVKRCLIRKERAK